MFINEPTVYRSTPLVNFAHLFTPGEYSISGINSNDLLPFMSHGSCWNIPAFALKKDCDNLGIRAAAAFTISIGHRGEDNGVSLREVITSAEFQADISAPSRPGHSAAAQFIRQIERYLWALGQLVSPTQIAADAEANIAEHEAISAME